MINVNLTNEEKLKLIEETKELVFEYNLLSMEIEVLKDQSSKIGKIKRTFNPQYREIYNIMEKKIFLKSRKILIISEKIDTNKKILGIKEKDKKKNKTL